MDRIGQNAKPAGHPNAAGQHQQRGGRQENQAVAQQLGCRLLGGGMRCWAGHPVLWFCAVIGQAGRVSKHPIGAGGLRAGKAATPVR